MALEEIPSRPELGEALLVFVGGGPGPQPVDDYDLDLGSHKPSGHQIGCGQPHLHNQWCAA